MLIVRDLIDFAPGLCDLINATRSALFMPPPIA
jgi:hypothetical protein